MKRKRKQSRLSIMLVLAMLVVMMTSILPVSAAGFSGSGKGTKSDPYLVTDAKQLDEVRNNLTAHYKLANTIDMSSVSNFKPIGNVAKPFKGTFSCDTNADGTPKYVIKNLKITVGEEHKSLTTVPQWQEYYKKDGTSGWEAALFGKAVNATFKNIVLLDVNIVNWVVGGSNTGSNWEFYNGQDEQGTAALLALGEGVTVTGCGATGNVTGRTNKIGGLIGQATNSSKIKNSYSYVTVDATGGVWSSGGLIGVINGTLDSCFYQGTFTGGVTNAGAFFGNGTNKSGAAAKVTNCWAAGTVKTESSGCFGGTKSLATEGYVEPHTYSENCYTLATIEGRTKAQTNKTTTSNNWITDGVGGLEIGFAAGSQAEINNAFKNLTAWVVVDGTYPQLKNVHPVTDASKYIPGQVDETAQNDGTGETEEENVNAGEGSETAQKGDTIKTTVKVDSASVTSVEKLLIIILAAIFVVISGLTVYTLVSNIRFLRKCKTSELKNENNVLETGFEE